MGLERATRTVLVVDLVESVRLMEVNEEEAIRRWRAVLDALDEHIKSIPLARVVKSLGDGVLIEFTTAQQALALALWLHSFCDSLVPVARGLYIRLRMGVHTCSVVQDHRDIFGSGVNLTARLAGLARPGAIAASAAFMADAKDLSGVVVEPWGACHLKHVTTPVQVLLLQPIRERCHSATSQAGPPHLDRPSIVVLPISSHASNARARLLTDRLTSLLRLSRALSLETITWSPDEQSLSDRLEEAARHGVQYVLAASFTQHSDREAVEFRLFDTRSAQQKWATRFYFDVTSESERSPSIVEKIHRSLTSAVRQHEHVVVKTLPSFSSSSLSLQDTAVSLMYAGSAVDFDNSHGLLRRLADRNPRFALAHAWLAQWYVMAVMRGLINRAVASAPALWHARRALQLDSECPHALAVLGYIQCHVLHDLAGASTTLDEATSRFPRDGLGWTYRAVVRGLLGDRVDAASSIRKAFVEPAPRAMRRHCEAIACTTTLSAGDPWTAIQMAQRSLAVNRAHIPTWRALAIAQSRVGQLDQARRTVRVLRKLQPALSVASYLAMWPVHTQAHFAGSASDLYRAGLPEESEGGAERFT